MLPRAWTAAGALFCAMRIASASDTGVAAVSALVCAPATVDAVRSAAMNAVSLILWNWVGLALLAVGSRAALGALPAALSHGVELCCLSGGEDALELLVSAVTECPGQPLNRVHLRAEWPPKLAHLRAAAARDRIELCPLSWRELQLLRHAVERGTPAAAVLFLGHQAVGSEAERAAGDKSTEQEHQCVAL